MAKDEWSARPNVLSRHLNTARQVLVDIIEVEGEARSLYTRLADTVINLRRTFQRDGQSDWAGRSQAYRDTISDLFEEMIEDPTERLVIRNRLDYHVGNRLRERVDPKELEKAGLKMEAPRDRKRERARDLRTMASAAGEDRVLILPESTPQTIDGLAATAQRMIEKFRDALDEVDYVTQRASIQKHIDRMTLLLQECGEKVEELAKNGKKVGASA